MDPKKLNLSDYRKDRDEKLDAVTTSLTLERRHKDFLESQNLNLSKLVRDFLDEIMKGKINGTEKAE